MSGETTVDLEFEKSTRYWASVDALPFVAMTKKRRCFWLPAEVPDSERREQGVFYALAFMRHLAKTGDRGCSMLLATIARDMFAGDAGRTNIVDGFFELLEAVLAKHAPGCDYDRWEAHLRSKFAQQKVDAQEWLERWEARQRAERSERARHAAKARWQKNAECVA